jgi:hypothetical protein
VSFPRCRFRLTCHYVVTFWVPDSLSISRGSIENRSPNRVETYHDFGRTLQCTDSFNCVTNIRYRALALKTLFHLELFITMVAFFHFVTYRFVICTLPFFNDSSANHNRVFLITPKIACYPARKIGK